MTRTVVLLLLLASGRAGAEGPWSIAIGAGPAVHRVNGTLASDGITLGASARLDAGYRFADSVAVGTHVGIAYVQGVQYGRYLAAPATYIQLEAGIGAQLVIADRVLIAPWIGVLDTAEPRYPAAGVALGFDVLERGHARISAVATFTTAREHFRAYPQTYNSIGGGVAYRYW